MWRWLLFAVAAGASAGCVTPLGARAKTIEDADEGMVRGCEYLGDVRSMSRWSAPLVGAEDPRNEGRERAAAIGATHILWVTEDLAGFPPFAMGRAYRCAVPEPAPPGRERVGPPPGCREDTDCYGERVCLRGRCVPSET